MLVRPSREVIRSHGREHSALDHLGVREGLRHPQPLQGADRVLGRAALNRLQ